MSEEKLRNLLEDYEQIDKVKQDLVKRISKEAKKMWGPGFVTSIDVSVKNGEVYSVMVHDYLRGGIERDTWIEQGDSPQTDLLLRTLAIDGVRLV